MTIIKIIRLIYRRIFPPYIRNSITQQYFSFRRFYFRKKIISFLESKEKFNLTEEEKKILSYLKKNKLSVFPGEFQNKYWHSQIDIHFDPVVQLSYVVLNGNKLFFKKGMPLEKIRKMVIGLRIEQDLESPHRYLTKNFDINQGDVFYDIGAAEASFSLEHIDKISKLFIFESDPLWVEALKATFKPWIKKVNIIEKYVTNSNNENNISLDHFIKNNPPPDFVKIDVEGEELNLLNGFRECLLNTNRKLKLIVCTYHKQNDEKEIGDFLSHHGFGFTPSSGFMLFYFDPDFGYPYLRRGLLRAEKI